MKKLGLYDLTPALCHLDYTMSDADCATMPVGSVLSWLAAAGLLWLTRRVSHSNQAAVNTVIISLQAAVSE